MTNNSIDGLNELQVAQKYHAQIFEMVNSRLTETSKFYVPLIAFFSGFGSLIIPSLNKSGSPHYSDLVAFAYYFSGIVNLRYILARRSIVPSTA